MSKLTNKYKLTYFQEGDITLSSPEMQRFETIDAQLYGLYSIIGNGIISGWELSSYSGLSIAISPGKGHVAFVAVESTQMALLSLVSSKWNYIYAVLDTTSYWTKQVNFVAFATPSSNSDYLYLGKVYTDANVVTQVDTTGRSELGFINLIKSLVASHRHIGGTNNPSPIDLSSEVQGVLGIDNLPDIDASKIKTGTVDSDRLPLIDHLTKLTGVGTLTHAQLDSFVEQFSIDNQKLMGEVSTVNLLQLVLALKHVYPDIDQYLVNEIAFIPGISPNDYIDTVNTTAVVDTRTYAEGGEHTITGTPSAGTRSYTKIWDSEDDFNDSTNSNIYITGDAASLSVNEDTAVIDEFPVLSGWTLETQDNSTIPSNITLDSVNYVTPKNYSPPYHSGELSINSEVIEVRLLLKKNFDAQDWSQYKYLKFYIKTESVEHGDLIFYFSDSFAGPQNSYIKVLDRNAPTVNIDTLQNGWQEVIIDLTSFTTRNSINEIGFYVSTAEGWDTSKGFDLNIDNIILTSGNIYKEDGYIRFIYGNNFPYTFWRMRWDAIIPSDVESSGVSLQARCRVANTIPGLSSAIWTPYTSTSGDAIPVSGMYKYIELEFYFTASDSLTRSPILKKAYLDYYVADVESSFELSKQSDWEAGKLFNIDTTTVSNAITVSNTEDIDTYYYGVDGGAYQLDSDLVELYKVVGAALPITTSQILNGQAPSLGMVTGVSRGNNGNLWITDIDNDRVVEVDKAGNLVRGFYGSFLTAPVDPYGFEEMGPGSNVVTNTTLNTSTSVISPTLTVLHSIYNPDTGNLYVVFDKDLENIYDANSSLNLSRMYIKIGSHKIFLNDSTVELVGVDESKYNIWIAASNSSSEQTSLISQFNFNSHVLKFTVDGAERTLLDYLLDQNNPSVIVASPTESQKVSSTVTLSFLTNNVDLSSDKLKVTLDGSNIQIIQQKTITYSGLSNGRHTIKVQILDSNNIAYSNIEAIVNMTFIVEGSYSQPIVYFTDPRPNQIFSSSPSQIGFQVLNFPIIPAGQHIQYILDSNDPEDYFSTDPIILNNLLPGKHTVRIYTVDENGNLLSYTYGDSTVEFIIGLNSNAVPVLYVESSAIKDKTLSYTTNTQRVYIATSNITLSNIYSPLDVQVIPEDDSQQDVTILVSKLRSPSWLNGLAGEVNAAELVVRLNQSTSNVNNAASQISSSNALSQVTSNPLLTNIPTKELIYGTKYLDGHSVVQLDMDGNVVFSNNAAIFAENKEQGKDILGSAEKIGTSELLIADANRQRAIVVSTNLTTQVPSVVWQYDSDRYISDFHLVNQDSILISITDGQIGETSLFARIGSTITWENNSSTPIAIYSGSTTYSIFEADPDLNLYGAVFKSSTLQPGERYSFKFDTEGSFDWFVYPSILTAKITITSRRLSDRDQYVILENDGLDSPFSSRVIKVDSWGNVIWSFGESYLVKPRDARPLIDGGILIST
jgi:hypothetical protein